jgi:hypothetical protein
MLALQVRKQVRKMNLPNYMRTILLSLLEHNDLAKTQLALRLAQAF